MLQCIHFADSAAEREPHLVRQSGRDPDPKGSAGAKVERDFGSEADGCQQSTKLLSGHRRLSGNGFVQIDWLQTRREDSQPGLCARKRPRR
jgi:hypothetical protein